MRDYKIKNNLGVMMLSSVLVLSGSGFSRAEPLIELTRPVQQLKTKSISKILVPEKALVRRYGIPGVFVVQDGRARFRMVKTGRTHKNKTIVLSGLFGDERLVLGDLADVRDGSPLNLDEQGN